MNIDEYCEDISVRLTEVLDASGLGADIRWKRINTWLQIEELDKILVALMLDNTNSKSFYFGSQAEATTTNELLSDIDKVAYENTVVVLQDLQLWVFSPDNTTTFLMVTDEGTPPRYVKLQLVQRDAPILVNNYQEKTIRLDNRSRSVLCNATKITRRLTAHEYHGPANTYYTIGIQMDTVCSLHTNCWPDQAFRWMSSRNRMYNWPSRRTIDAVQTTEALLMPVGHKLSPELHLEWRLSFSFVEKLLTWQFNSTQYKCYVMLKFIKNTFINVDLREKILTSYHCKKCMFYLIENTPAVLWRPSHLMFCIDMCLRLLLSWVEGNNCPNYFIPEENMFLGRCVGLVQQNVSTILHDLLWQKRKYITMISYESIGGNFARVCQSLPMELDHVNEKTLQISFIYLLHLLELLCIVVANLKFCKLNVFKSSHGLRQEVRNMILQLLCSSLGNHLASQSLEVEIPNQEKLGMEYEFLLLGSSSDVASGNLKLAAFYLAQSNINALEELLNHVEANLTHRVWEYGESAPDEISSMILRGNLSVAKLIQHYVALMVFYGPLDIYSVPKVLIFAMFRSTGSESGLDRLAIHWIPTAAVRARVVNKLQNRKIFVTMNIPEYYKDLSIRLTEVLDASGLGDDIRWWRINTWFQIEEFEKLFARIKNETISKVCYFGSQAEATTTGGLFSDIDKLLVLNSKKVLQNLQFWELSPSTEETFLMVADDSTPPGYVKLQLVQRDAPILVNNYQNETILTDSKRRSVLCNNTLVIEMPQIEEYHGPASSACYNGVTMDMVAALQAYYWPDKASKWLSSRGRRYNWPTRQIINAIQQTGVFFVPVGHKLSSEQHLEWRLSFSYGEKLLMMKFNSTQYKCYVMLKYIKKMFINMNSREELLTSYHCKTCMFYVIENTPAYLWQPNNLLFCVELCLRQLLSWVECNHCPNYFIPEENMFLGRNLGAVQGKITSILHELLGQNGRYITRISYENIGENVVRVCQSRPMELVNPNAKTLETTFLHLATILAFASYVLAASNTVRLNALILSHGLRHEMGNIVRSLCFSGLGSHLTSQSLEYDIPNQKYLTMAHELLLLGCTSDKASGNLKLAAFYLALNNLDIMEDVLNHVAAKLTYIFGADGMLPNEDTFSKFVREDVSLAQIVQHYLSLSVYYVPSDIHSMPKVLILEIFRSTGSEPRVDTLVEHWIPIDVIVPELYLYFLQYQCYYLQGRVALTLIALSNIIWIAQVELQVLHTCVANTADVSWRRNILLRRLISLVRFTTTLNLLAYCLKQGVRPMDAFKVLCKSMKMKNHHNAAKWQIATLINSTVRVSNIRRRQ
ncbi:hypothetical protein CHS0354_007604 [Potamilus streckersoni]|uniref:Mab-21-like HhH/H2TH-like domain-containing protein n=1 Tax=Potamilus streckersoni TaxID=2493646 RepID=A0AAE0T4D5_9BIVA|nr:hypothetical protein CHS0354_007604 [Potamilus streckersoni]